MTAWINIKCEVMVLSLLIVYDGIAITSFSIIFITNNNIITPALLPFLQQPSTWIFQYQYTLLPFITIISKNLGSYHRTQWDDAIINFLLRLTVLFRFFGNCLVSVTLSLWDNFSGSSSYAQMHKHTCLPIYTHTHTHADPYTYLYP